MGIFSSKADKAEIDRLSNLATTLNSQLTQLTNENSTLKNRANNLTVGNDNLLKNIDELKSTNVQISSDKRMMELQLEKITRELQEIKSLLKKLEDEESLSERLQEQLLFDEKIIASLVSLGKNLVAVMLKKFNVIRGDYKDFSASDTGRLFSQKFMGGSSNYSLEMREKFDKYFGNASWHNRVNPYMIIQSIAQVHKRLIRIYTLFSELANFSVQEVHVSNSIQQNDKVVLSLIKQLSADYDKLGDEYSGRISSFINLKEHTFYYNYKHIKLSTEQLLLTIKNNALKETDIITINNSMLQTIAYILVDLRFIQGVMADKDVQACEVVDVRFKGIFESTTKYCGDLETKVIAKICENESAMEKLRSEELRNDALFKETFKDIIKEEFAVIAPK